LALHEQTQVFPTSLAPTQSPKWFCNQCSILYFICGHGHNKLELAALMNQSFSKLEGHFLCGPFKSLPQFEFTYPHKPPHLMKRRFHMKLCC